MWYFRLSPSINVTEIVFPWIINTRVKAQYVFSGSYLALYDGLNVCSRC